MAWAPTGDYFCAVYGFMPAKATLYNCRGDVVLGDRGCVTSGVWICDVVIRTVGCNCCGRVLAVVGFVEKAVTMNAG